MASHYCPRGRTDLGLTYYIFSVVNRFLFELDPDKMKELFLAIRDDYLKQQIVNTENYHKELIEELKENLKELRTSDIKTLEKRSKELEEIQLDSKDAIDSVIEDSLGDFKERVEDILSERIENLKHQIEGDAEAEDKKETHT
ncbi:MAG: hypothetical protein LBB43_06230, partial [Spirochaetaceae bacterium]|nr:hypothetical protein [Spirochaetaceae bacterium]